MAQLPKFLHKVRLILREFSLRIFEKTALQSCGQKQFQIEASRFGYAEIGTNGLALDGRLDLRVLNV